jgi:pimeloyl-ACP methyl ester carboxylesterase
MKLNEGYHEYFANIDGYQIYFQCKFNPKSEEVVVLIHGLACSSDSFRNVFDKDYFPEKSLLILDLVGFGKSSKPDDFSYTMEDQAKLIEDLLSLLPFTKIHIVAHSMGGAIALLLQPNRFLSVKSFTNIEGNLISEDCGALSRGIASLSFQEYQKDLFRKQLIEFEGHHQLQFKDSIPCAVHRSAVSLVEWSYKGMLLDKFKLLTSRKCYFYGEQNKELPILEKLDFVKRFVVSNSGHGLMTENPKEFYTRLVEFIG